MTAKVIALAMQKGGTGKTVSAVNLAYVLAEHGKRVLLVDLDPQGNASVSTGVYPNRILRADGNRTLWACIKSRYIASEGEEGTLGIRDVRIRREWNRGGPSFDLLPSALDLSEAARILPGAMGRDRFLAYLLEDVREEYDVVLIDCLPSLGELLVMALCASDYVLIPLEAQHLALYGMGLLLNTVREVIRLRLNSTLKILGIFFTKVDMRTKQSQDVVQAAHSAYDKMGWVFENYIPVNTTISDATTAGRPVVVLQPGSAGAIAFRRLGQELLERLEGADDA